jgi:hypothetical protein
LRFLSNLTADIILTLGIIGLVILAIPLILVEVLFHTDLIKWVLLGAIILWIYKVGQKDKKNRQEEDGENITVIHRKSPRT